MLLSIQKRAEKLLDLASDRIAGMFLPQTSESYLDVAREKLSQFLSYEDSIIDEDGREVILLSDGGQGYIWEMGLIPHEILNERELDYKLSQFGKVFEKLIGDRLSIQVHFVKESASHFRVPEWYETPDTFARKVYKKRIEKIKSLKDDDPKLQSFKVYIFMRYDPSSTLAKPREASLDYFIISEVKKLKDDVYEFQSLARIFEDVLSQRVEVPLQRKGKKELIHYLKSILHGKEDKRGKFFEKDYELNDTPLREQILKGSIRWENGAIGLGDDTVEVLSWKSQPNHLYPGLMSYLLQIDGDFHGVLNIRPKNYTADLEAKSENCKGEDPYQKRQKLHLDEAHTRIVGGEKFLHTSFHLFYRNVGVHIDEPKKNRKGKEIVAQTSDYIPVFKEEEAAYLAFIASLPMMYSKKIAPRLGREYRVLSDDIGYLVPVLGGMEDKAKPKQLMQSRTGEAIWLNNRQSLTNPHYSILGISGAGKSFFTVDHLTAEHAYDSDVITIIIDSITSYRYLALTVGEDHGSKIVKPPESFPNIFYGDINTDRLAIIVDTIKIATSIISGVELSSSEQTLLGDAILHVYEANLRSATQRYVKSKNESDIGQYEARNSDVSVPRLSSVVNAFAVVGAKKNLSKSLIASLTEKLLPFYGTGPYAKVFDQKATKELEEKSPAMIIYDLGDIKKNEKLCTVTTILLIAEAERIISHPLNKSRSGNLVFEEAQTTLKSKSPILAEFMSGAYERFRALNWSCGCVANSAKAYIEQDGPQSAWKLSGTNIVLPIYNDAERSLLPKLIKDDYHCELVGSLEKSSKFSQFLWLGNPSKGTGVYVATGYGYWLTAKNPKDQAPIEFVHSHLTTAKPYQDAIHILSNFCTGGFRDSYGELRELLEHEKTELLELIKTTNEKGGYGA